MDPLPLKDFNLIVETKSPAEKATLQWSIKNFHKLPKQIRSSKFSLVPGKPSEWDMMICHTPDNNKFEMRLAYHAQRDAPLVEIRSIVRVLKNQGSMLEHDYRRTNLFHGGDQHSLGSWSKFPVSENDTLVFQCSMHVHGYNRLNSRNLYSDKGDAEDIEDLRSDYLEMLKSKEFADKELEMEGEDFPVHRCVLESLAPELLNQWMPKQDGDVNILSVSPTMFADVLQNIYSGKVDHSAIASEYEMYYSLSFDFKLKRLLRETLRVIIAEIIPGNVRGIHILAKDYGDKELMKYCESYMKDNPQI